MARFFLALGVRGQHVAEALPHVAQPVQLSADGVVGQPAAAAVVQVLLEQGDRPVHPGVAQLVGALLQAGQQQRLEVISPGAGATDAIVVVEGGRVRAGGEGAGPVVHSLARHP
jgi:CHASE1-domain containing sensor protein